MSTIQRELHREHVRLVRELQRLAEALPEQRSERRAELDRLGVRIGVHLVVEEAILAPVVRRLLDDEEPEHGGRLRIDRIVDHLLRAIDAADDVETRTELDHVREELTVHIERTEISVLPLVYRVFEDDRARALVDVYHRASDELREQFDGQMAAHDPRERSVGELAPLRRMRQTAGFRIQPQVC